MDNADRLLERLHREGVRPVPRSRVVLRRAMTTVLFGASLLLGAVSVALALGDLFPKGGRGWHFRVALSDAAPWIWLLTSAFLLIAGMRLFRALPRGWRVRPVRLLLACLGPVLVLGSLLHATDALLGTHRFIAHHVPSYKAAWKGHVRSEGGHMRRDEKGMKDSAGCGRNQR
jgi:hypothetical protein